MFCKNNKVLEQKTEKNRAKKSLYSCMVAHYLFMTGRNKAGFVRVLWAWFMSPSFRVNVWVEKMKRTKTSFFKRLISNRLESKYSITVSPTSKIGNNLRIDHFHGVVIGRGAVIGDFCKLYQQVTIGQKDGKFPTIGNHVTIYPGAKVIGDITVGDGAVIGANAVVTKDVPAGCVAAGVPAKIIKAAKA